MEENNLKTVNVEKKCLGEKKYKNFDETFRYCAFAMAVGLIYPNYGNKKTMACKSISFFLIVAIGNGPALFWFWTYLYKCIVTRDIFNVSRQLTIGILIFLFFFKTIYMNVREKSFGELISKISTDLQKGNEMGDEDQKIYDKYIAQGKLGEKIWISIPSVLSTLFPIYATVTMTYKIFTDDPFPWVMVHEMELMGLKDIQFQSPCFQIIFAYEFLQCCSLVPNFCGFDGSFCIAITHLCLKLKLFTRKLTTAFQESRTEDELVERLKDAVKAHQEALEFYNLIQDLYGAWLLVSFLLVSIVISLNLYQVSINIDAKYFTFAMAAVGNTFTPCYFAGNLTVLGDEVCNEIYANTNWESRSSPKVNKMLNFMIARAKEPLVLTGMGLVIYNMELFVSILQTSWSFFTLIRD